MTPSRSTATPAPPTMDELQQAATLILSMANITGCPRLTPLQGGPSHRAYQVDLPDGSLILKVYFQEENDPRDLLNAEFTFLKHLWAMGLRQIPQPIARIPLRQIAMYGRLQGQPFTPESIQPTHVAQVAALVTTINQQREAFAGQDNSPQWIVEDRPGLAWASDACFSLAEHLVGIEARMSRLLALPATDDSDAAVLAFVRDDLLPTWSIAAARVRTRAQAMNLNLNDLTPAKDRLLSPCDLGFDHALRLAGDEVGFLHFESAGWDDPAKLVCDFFSQTAIPVSHDYLASFMDTLAKTLHEPERFRQHVQLLLPAYQLKWCAMALNSRLPMSQARRAFLGKGEQTGSSALALSRARALLQAYHQQHDRAAG